MSQHKQAALHARLFVAIAFFALSILFLFLSGCHNSQPDKQSTNDFPRSSAHQLIDKQPSLANIQFCHGYGCRMRSSIHLSGSDWAYITDPLKNIKSAEQERAALAQTIARYEMIIGDIAGTYRDKARSPAFAVDKYQLDCIDESVNTSTLLDLLDLAGLLHWHQPATPAKRGSVLSSNWPHNTAVIQEKMSAAFYAVDSWFHENGRAAEIVLLEQWLGGWQPAAEP